MNDTNRNELKDFISKGPISRREFMSRATALGLSLSAAASFWSSAATASPNKGGHLRVGTDGGATSDTFNPMVSLGTDHVTQAILACYDTLTEIDASGSPVPSLAESWDVSDDGKTWKFKIRSGVEFHDGKPLTPADVVWSLNQHLSENNTFAEGKQIIGNIETMSADGDSVVMVQKEVNFDLPAHLSSFGLIIGQENTADWNAAIGTGPYVKESFEPGVSFKGSKFANFYRDDQGHFDSVELINIADVANRTNALRSDSVDVIGQPDTKTAAMLDRLDGFTLLQVPGTQHYTTAMRTDTDPFTDNNLRMAVKYGINRQEILDKIFGGYGYIGNDHPIGRGVQFYNDQLPQREYDPDKARYYLQQAGLENVDLSLSTSDGAFSGAVDAAALMQVSMKPVGINVDINRAPADGYWSDVWLKAPWCFVYWNGRPTVDWMLSSTYTSDSDWNDTYFRNEQFDAMLASARGEKDEAKRRQLYFDCQEIFANEGGTTVLVFANILSAKSDKLAHGELGVSRRMDDSRLARRWWYA